MPLTKEQVQTIFQLVKEHIPYYDLQVEMVDHLASNVEEKLEADPGLPFEQALQTAYAGFGSSGFKLLIRKRRRSLLKQKWALWFQVLLQQFNTYRIVYTIAAFTMAIFVALLLTKEVKGTFLLFAYMSYIIILAVEGIIRIRAKNRLLLTELFSASLFGSMFLPSILVTATRSIWENAFGYAIVVTALLLMLKATVFVNKTLLQKAKTLYPEAFVKA